MPESIPEQDQCQASNYWWEGEYEGECELRRGHDGPHFDGSYWFEENEQVDPPPDSQDRGGQDA